MYIVSRFAALVAAWWGSAGPCDNEAEMARASGAGRKMLDSDWEALQRNKRAEAAEMHVRYMKQGFPRHRVKDFPVQSDAEGDLAALAKEWAGKSIWSMWGKGHLYQYFITQFLISDEAGDATAHAAIARLLARTAHLLTVESKAECARLCSAVQTDMGAKGGAVRDAALAALPALHEASRTRPYADSFLPALQPLLQATATAGHDADATCDAFCASAPAKALVRALFLCAMPVDTSEFIEHMVLAYGGFGKVEICWSARWQKCYAVKRQNIAMVMAKEHERKVHLEWRVQKETHSRFILPAAFAYIDGNDLVLGLQYMAGGDLAGFTKIAKNMVAGKQVVVDHSDKQRFGIDSCVSEPGDKSKSGLSGFGIVYYLASVVLALEALHAAGFVYRDLKDRNVLLDASGQAKLGDFGLAEDVSKGAASGSAGTKGYWAPEQVAKKSSYTYSPDYWTLGVCAYHWTTLKLPFEVGRKEDENGNVLGKDQMKELIKQRVLNDTCAAPAAALARKAPPRPLLTAPPHAGSFDTAERPALKALPHVHSFITDLLVKDPKQRLGADGGGWQAVRDHKVFKSIDWERLSRGKLPAPILPDATKLNAELPSQAKEEFAKFEEVTPPEGASDVFAYWTVRAPIGSPYVVGPLAYHM